MTWKSARSYALSVTRIIGGGIYVYAGVIKAMDVQGFAENIAAYQILHSPLLEMVSAAVLPYIEIIAGLLLVFGIWPMAALSILVGLTVFFSCCLTSLIVRDIVIDCGCFSTDSSPMSQTSPTAALVRDLVILAILAACYKLSRNKS